MRLARLKPSPQPRCLVVNPGRKTCDRFFFFIPFPVSLTSTQILLSSSTILTVIVPGPPLIASTAFLHKFSITHSKRDAFILSHTSLSGKSLTKTTPCDVLRSIYSITCSKTSLRLVGTGSGREPIFEKRSEISCSRFTSLSISGINASSGYCSLSISVHAIREDIGVPN